MVQFFTVKFISYYGDIFKFLLEKPPKGSSLKPVQFQIVALALVELIY
jgi:hypothetical protein